MRAVRLAQYQRRRLEKALRRDPSGGARLSAGEPRLGPSKEKQTLKSDGAIALSLPCVAAGQTWRACRLCFYPSFSLRAYRNRVVLS
jgi:hypothetical protein